MYRNKSRTIYSCADIKTHMTVHSHRAEAGDDNAVVAVEAVGEPYEVVVLLADELHIIQLKLIH